MDDMEFIVCGIMGYLFGNINPAYIISKRRGFDIRSKGSHNAGASNMVIVVGEKAGAITAILDIAKAYLSATFAAILFPSYRIAKEIAALFCILGHIFPVAIKFKGGKGLACIAGGVLAYNAKAFIILLAIEAVFALITDYVCVIPISASIIIPALYAHVNGDTLVLVLMCITACIIIFKHLENLKRIYHGMEFKISFLWNRDGEIKRLQENSEKNAEC